MGDLHVTSSAAAASEPQLSVVVASVNGQPYITSCLDALARQEEVVGEVIVADCVGPEVTEFVRSAHPSVRLLAFEEPKSVPELRAAGIAAARAEIISITEDHCIPPPDWFRAIVKAHRESEHPAIGGAVDNAATQSIVDWAVFFCEYSTFISPVPAGEVDDLPGPNVSYKRAALDEMRDLLADGYWETFLHWRLQQRGHPLWSDPRVRVDHLKHYRLGEFFVERFHYGRAFAGHRCEFIDGRRRALYLLGSPLLPPVLLLRILRRVLDRRRHLGAFLRSVPSIALFLLAWAAGEWTGYAFGPGRSNLEFS